jgi:hypothetical protein
MPSYPWIWVYRSAGPPIVAYYDEHAAEFCEDTASADMADVNAPFTAQLSAGGRVPDAGCGSERVVAIDVSAEMVKATTMLTGQQALLIW